jgi:hypothetical protein
MAIEWECAGTIDLCPGRGEMYCGAWILVHFCRLRAVTSDDRKYSGYVASAHDARKSDWWLV